jgi:hypothetical protein
MNIYWNLKAVFNRPGRVVISVNDLIECPRKSH